MHINSDLSSGISLASLQNESSEAGAGGTQLSSSTVNDSSASGLDSSLQSLTNLPTDVQDANWEIQDEQEAAQSVESLRQGLLGQPGAGLTAQASQLPANILNLLQ